MGQPCEVAQECQLEAADVAGKLKKNKPPCGQEGVSTPLADDHVYDFVRTVAEGSYGDVHECIHAPTGQRVAIKRFKAAHLDPQIWRLAMRELRVLQTLPRHPNIVELKRAVCSQSSGRLFFVFELLHGSLLGELSRLPGGFLPPAALKQVAWQLLQAVAHCHDNKVVHRDVKPANVLVSDAFKLPPPSQEPQGMRGTGGGGAAATAPTVKLCDFGFARWIPTKPREGTTAAALHLKSNPNHDGPDMSAYVVTRWYRPPEVIVDDAYGTAVDIWSYGCTLAELASGQPLFPGCSSADQLWRISRCLGPLPPAIAARCRRDSTLAAAVAAPEERGRTLAQRLRGVSPLLLELITACLSLEPSRRPSARELMRLPYFWDIQRPVLPESLQVSVARQPPRPVGKQAMPHDSAAVAAPDAVAATAAIVCTASAASVAAATDNAANANPSSAATRVGAETPADAATEACTAVPSYSGLPQPAPPQCCASGLVSCEAAAVAIDGNVSHTASDRELRSGGGKAATAADVHATGGGTAPVAMAAPIIAGGGIAAAAPSEKGDSASSAPSYLRRSVTAVVRPGASAAVHVGCAPATSTGVTAADLGAGAGRQRFASRASRLFTSLASVGANGHRRLSGQFPQRGCEGGCAAGTTATTTVPTTNVGHATSPLNQTSVHLCAGVLNQQEPPPQQQHRWRWRPLQPLPGACDTSHSKAEVQPWNPHVYTQSARVSQVGTLLPPIVSPTGAAAAVAAPGSTSGTHRRANRNSLAVAASKATRSCTGAILDASRPHDLDPIEDELYDGVAGDGSGGDNDDDDGTTVLSALLCSAPQQAGTSWRLCAATAEVAANELVRSSWLGGGRRGMPAAAAVAVPPALVPSAPPAPVPRCPWRSRLETDREALSSASNSLTTLSPCSQQLSLICSLTGVPSPSAVVESPRYDNSKMMAAAPPPPLPFHRGGGGGSTAATCMRAEAVPVGRGTRSQTRLATTASLSTGGIMLSTGLGLLNTEGGAGAGGCDSGTITMTAATDFLLTSGAGLAPTCFASVNGGGAAAGAGAAAATQAAARWSRVRPCTDTVPTDGLFLPAAPSDPTLSPGLMDMLTYDSDVRTVRAPVGSAARRWNVAAAPPACISRDTEAAVGRCYITKNATTGGAGRSVASISSSGLAVNNRIFPGGIKLLATAAASEGCCSPGSTADGKICASERRGNLFPGSSDDGGGGGGGTDGAVCRSNGGAGVQREKSDGAGVQREKGGKARLRLVGVFQTLKREMQSLKSKALAVF